MRFGEFIVFQISTWSKYRQQSPPFGKFPKVKISFKARQIFHTLELGKSSIGVFYHVEVV